GTEFVPSTPAWTQIDAQGDIKTMLQTVATEQATVEQATETAAAAMDKAFSEAP
ncbi:MAG: extracellular solute-binding protein, partial [Oerskovia sp.]|nr:extracellular solute-binding protein [Oerskovia sp.]